MPMFKKHEEALEKMLAENTLGAVVWPEAPKFNQDLTKGGVKHDIGKPRYELIAPEFLHGLAEILTFGANKYEDRNWERGMAWGRPFGALMRHMWAWWNGEALDPETGKSHLHHAACCLMFLSAYEARQIGIDDRTGDFDVLKITRPEHDHKSFSVSDILVGGIPNGSVPIQEPLVNILREGRNMRKEEAQRDLFEDQIEDAVRVRSFANMVTQIDTNDDLAADAFRKSELLPHFRVLGKRKIYLAGPMRNIPHFNFPAFNKATARLRSVGFYVFNPAEADINRQGDENFVALNATGCLDTATEQGFDLRSALAEDAEFICREADMIVMLPGWERSKGATAEKALATALGLDVLYFNGEYPEFVQSN